MAIDLTQKLGPIPIWGWGLAAAGGAYLFIRHARAASAAAAGSSGGGGSSPGQFSSSVTSTDPKTGSSSTYSASGPTGSIGTPAQLVYGAGQMGYSSGDIYVNYPDQAATPGPAGPPGPQGPPGHSGPPAPHPPRNPDWGKWETVTDDDRNDPIGSVTRRVLGDPGFGDKVWNDPVNKAVHDLRGDPNRLQPGDVVWVFDGWKPGWKPPADFVPYNPDPAHPSPAGPTVKPPPPDASAN